MKQDTIRDKIEISADKRSRLIASAEDCNAFRLVNGAADDLQGIVIEQFGAVLIVQYHEDRATVSKPGLRSALKELMPGLGAASAYLKEFLRDRSDKSDEIDEKHNSPTPWIGNPADEEFEIVENGLRFRIRPYDGFSVGLFLEHRDNRRRIRQTASGRRVLNLYAYTCGFSVAAVVGGAEEVTSVDISARYLDWGRRNFAANQADIEKHRFIKSDAEDFLARAKRQDRSYDLIVIDPPTFARMRRPKRVFKLDEQLEPLVAAAVDRLTPGGTILFGTNQRNISIKRIDAAMYNAAPNRRPRKLDRPRLPTDFAGDDDFAKTVIAEFD